MCIKAWVGVGSLRNLVSVFWIPIIQRYQSLLLIYRIDTQYLLIRYMGWYGDTMYWTISLLLPFFNDKTYCNFWSHSENFCIAEQNFMKVFETLSEMFQFCHLNSLGSSILVQLDTQCFNCSLSFKTYFLFLCFRSLDQATLSFSIWVKQLKPRFLLYL